MHEEGKSVVCKDCGVTFDITPGEQEFYLERGWELPKRCKKCRQANKAKKKQNFKKGENK